MAAPHDAPGDDLPTPPDAVPLPDLEPEDTVPGATARRSRVPWGSLALVVLYVLVTGAYLGVSYFLSDDFAVGRAVAEGDALLGEDQGRGVENDDLVRAASSYLDALLVDPDLGYAHKRLESIKWRFQERGATFPHELQMRWAAVAARSRAGKVGQNVLDTLPVTPDERFGLTRARATLKSRLYWVATGLFLLLLWSGIRWWMRVQAEDDARPDGDDRGSAMY